MSNMCEKPKTKQNYGWFQFCLCLPNICYQCQVNNFRPAGIWINGFMDENKALCVCDWKIF